MKHLLVNKLFVVLIIAFFVSSFLPQIETTLAAPEDNWVAYPLHISRLNTPLFSGGYSPSQIKTAYGLPQSGGAGTTIAIIDAYVSPNIQADLATFCTNFGLPAANLEVHPMTTGIDTKIGWTEETCLDVEWAHAIAPDAKILLVEARSPSNYYLFQAVDYARNRPDVVSISMSWGGFESSSEINWDNHFTSNYGAVFFASSGDEGAGVIWPASSTNVVSVGGTTLNINPVISETAWSGSGGGVSAFEPIPDYQTNFGLTTSNREVPDVSYDGDPSTGFAVYCNSQWYVMGGTSAGAPQWAAICALDRSVTNANLYAKATSAYSSYFRDIISGSNGNNAAVGYDYVTGLGSPITCKFGTDLTISPTSGPAGATITLNGAGFSPDSSADISWLDSSVWIMLGSEATDSAGNLTYTFTAPDLLQNNLAGDNQPSSNNIIFRAQDNSNGKSYNTSIPYTEYCKGLTQISNASATGIYGNNTDLTTTVFVQNGQLITIAGKWFNPGVTSMFWDGSTSLDTMTIDETGQFSATIQIPTTTAGQHTLTLNNANSTFCVNVTRLPSVTTDYDGQWHTSPFNITLTPDYNVNEIYYSINGGQVFSVTANGQPSITNDGNNNTLEYWSSWDVYGTGNMDLTHKTLSGIQLDTTPPQGSILINNGAATTSSSNVALTVTATDAVSGVSQMRFSNDNTSWDQSQWISYSNSQNWQLTIGDGAKTVYCQIEDNAGLVTSFSSSIGFSTPLPTQTLSPSVSTPTPTQIPQQTPTPSPTNSPTPQASPSAIVPELGFQMFLVLTVLATLLFAVAYKRKHL